MVNCRCGGKSIKVPKATAKKVTPKHVAAKNPKNAKVTNKNMSSHLSKLATIKAKKASGGCKCS